MARDFGESLRLSVGIPLINEGIYDVKFDVAFDIYLSMIEIYK